MPPDIPPERTNRNDVRFIGPVDLSPPGNAHSAIRPRGKLALVVVAGLLLLMATAGGVLLMRHISDRPLPGAESAARKTTPKPAPGKNIPPSPSPAAAPSPPRVDPDLKKRQKKTAGEQLTGFLMARRRLEAMGASQWGDSAYDEIVQLADDGDARYRRENFMAAAELYSQATHKAALLADRAPEAREKLIGQALADITAGDGQSARQKLQTALKIGPQNKRVDKLLRRAASAEEVQQLYEQGRGLEKNGAPEKALSTYGRALKLDPDARRVREAFGRLKTQVAGQKYRRFMSDGLAALERHEYREARALLLKARAARADGVEAKDALAQAEAGLQQQRMENLRKQALAAEAAENWPLALQSYQAVLKMDDKVGFAVDGRKRAATQINRLQRLDFFLKKPQSLQDNRQLEKARQLIHELETTPVAGPRTMARAGRLSELIKVWETPVAVTIRSDGTTRVAVYRVGRLGSFTEKIIALRPGTYTVVGSRDGYQDVRQVVTVKPGQQSLQITITCKTKIW